VITLLADANIEGQVAYLAARMQGETWREFWDHLQLRCATFDQVGLNRTDPDSVVWQRCQELGLLLITDNRNLDSADSLEDTIRRFNTPESLPVFTVGRAKNILSDAAHAERVIDRLFRYLLELDSVRGAGRLFLP
jgi:hypothetical protein